MIEKLRIKIIYENSETGEVMQTLIGDGLCCVRERDKVINLSEAFADYDNKYQHLILITNPQ